MAVRAPPESFWFAIVTVEFIGAFILIVAQRKVLERGRGDDKVTATRWLQRPTSK
jgi:hypothetical protein